MANARSDREARLKATLRENLKKRKERERSEAAVAHAPDGNAPATPDSGRNDE